MCLMNEKHYKPAFVVAAVAAVSFMIAAAYLYGKADGAGPRSTAAPKLADPTRTLLGNIVRVDPPHLYVESIGQGTQGTYDVLIGPKTEFLQLVPWEPGEKEAAQKAHEAYLKKVDPKPGDPVLPPPQEMKPARIDARTFVPGTKIGVLSAVGINPAEPIFAIAIRPLLFDEIHSGQVSSTFPLQ